MIDAGKGKIFIAEDNLEVSRMYERAFRLNGHEVALAYDGELAQRGLLAMEETPAAILLDINMPHMNGLDLMLAIREISRFKDVPIVVLTNSFYKEDQERFLSAGADLYLIKIEHQVKDVVSKVEALIHKSADKEGGSVVQ